MQLYSDLSRESDPYSLPDVEVFYHDGNCEDCEKEGIACGDFPSAGWYYWYCFPGCMPDSEPTGPFNSEELAVEAVREDKARYETGDSKSLDSSNSWYPEED